MWSDNETERDFLNVSAVSAQGDALVPLGASWTQGATA